MNYPVVSVIIPTRNRPDLLIKAINSVLVQTIAEIEIIIVVDGPDSATESKLSAISDKRLTVIALPESIGGAEARNLGVRQASAEWVAFLDDDDEWLPSKLEEQLHLAMISKQAYPVVACKVVAVHQGGSREIWPRRLPTSHESISDYLLLRRTYFGGESTFLTSMILAKKELLLRIPFHNIKKHQDWDWLLKASRHTGFELLYTDAPLVIYNNTIRPRISTGPNSRDWQSSLAWIESNKEIVSKAAYSSFLCTEVARRARNDRDIIGLISIFSKAIFSKAINVQSIVAFFSICLISQNLRTRTRNLFTRFKL